MLGLLKCGILRAPKRELRICKLILSFRKILMLKGLSDKACAVTGAVKHGYQQGSQRLNILADMVERTNNMS